MTRSDSGSVRHSAGAQAGKVVRLGWGRVFLTGLGLWCLSVLTTELTGNINTVPSVVLLGSFLVPVTVVVWCLDHYRTRALDLHRVVFAFVVGGALGVLAASLLEAWLLSDGLLTYAGVGLIEEAVKLGAILLAARGLTNFWVFDGIVLGAIVGSGFAAFESSGYALTSLLTSTGQPGQLSVSALVFTEIVRGVLTPVGHSLWTAILGGALFAGAARRGRIGLTWGTVGAYLLVSLLHAFWDAMHGVAAVLTALLTAGSQDRVAVGSGAQLHPSEADVALFTVIDWGGLIVVALIGAAILYSLCRRARPRGAGQPAPPRQEETVP